MHTSRNLQRHRLRHPLHFTLRALSCRLDVHETVAREDRRISQDPTGYESRVTGLAGRAAVLSSPGVIAFHRIRPEVLQVGGDLPFDGRFRQSVGGPDQSKCSAAEHEMVDPWQRAVLRWST